MTFCFQHVFLTNILKINSQVIFIQITRKLKNKIYILLNLSYANYFFQNKLFYIKQTSLMMILIYSIRL
jgi:hypothetical protein